MGYNTQPLTQLPEWCVSGNINYQWWLDATHPRTEGMSLLWMSDTIYKITPTRCSVGDHEPSEQCCNQATWEYNGYPLCVPCMAHMAAMNDSNEEVFRVALDDAKQKKETQYNA